MKTYLIDLDGTMYSGNENIPGAIEFIQHLQKNNIPYIFLTNNATRTKLQNKQHMEKLGFKNIKEEDFFTSSMAAAKYIAKTDSKRNAFVVGQDGLTEALIAEGFKIVDEAVDFVFVGLNTQGDYQLYSRALFHLVNGAKLIGTNKDRKLPSGSTFKIGNGAVVAMLEYASQQEAFIAGKPYDPILNEVLSFKKLSKEDVVLLGDNLETDIDLGYRHGIETIMVTTGVHTVADCNVLGVYPTQIVESLFELIK